MKNLIVKDYLTNMTFDFSRLHPFHVLTQAANSNLLPMKRNISNNIEQKQWEGIKVTVTRWSNIYIRSISTHYDNKNNTNSSSIQIEKRRTAFKLYFNLFYLHSFSIAIILCQFYTFVVDIKKRKICKL